MCTYQHTSPPSGTNTLPIGKMIPNTEDAVDADVSMDNQFNALCCNAILSGSNDVEIQVAETPSRPVESNDDGNKENWASTSSTSSSLSQKQDSRRLTVAKPEEARPKLHLQLPLFDHTYSRNPMKENLRAKATAARQKISKQEYSSIARPSDHTYIGKFHTSSYAPVPRSTNTYANRPTASQENMLLAKNPAAGKFFKHSWPRQRIIVTKRISTLEKRSKKRAHNNDLVIDPLL